MQASSNGQESVRLRLERVSDRDMKIRDLYVSVDDLPERTLEFGDTTEFTLSPGEHEVKANNRLFKAALTFTAQAGESITIEAANTQRIGVLNMLTFIGGGLIYRPVLWRE